MTLTMSCALVPDKMSPGYAALAESLGYRRAWFYDSPALYPDVWVQMCRAAARTQRIGLATGVLVPSNRHVMTTASAIATLVDAAGADRVAVGVGTGFTSRMAMGKPALTWNRVEHYVRTLRVLLAGELAEWDGALLQMLHSPGLLPPRPIRVPILLAADGPRGQGIAREIADGVIGTRLAVPGFDWSVVLSFGTVLEDGEDPGSDRSLAAAGHAGGVMLHYLHSHGLLTGAQQAEWLTGYESVPTEKRHLAMHTGHLTHLNEHDRGHVTGDRLSEWLLAMPEEGWADLLAAMEAAGATEIAYQPAGPDIPRELEAFARAYDRYSSRQPMS